MRIGYTHHAFCRQAYTGISRYWTRLITSLTSQGGVDARIFAPFYTNKFLSEMGADLVSGRHIPIDSVITRPASRYVNSRLAPHQLAHWNPDLVHETYYSAISSAPRGCRTILTVYDMIHEKFPDDFHRFDKTRELKKIAVSRADHIICISENTRQDLISLLNVPWEKTSVIHLGVDSPPNGLSCSPEEGIKRPYLLYIGQRGGYKNFLGLIKAYAVSADLTNDFDIICFGGGAFSKSEKKLFDQLKIGNKIHRAGGSDDILCRLFAHATLLVYPSLYEGFGLPPLEAMVHGCPVACSNTSSIPEVVGNAGAYFDPNDVESIRATLEDVATAQQKRQELSEAGFSRHKKFTWEKCAEETLSVYQRLI